jgi:hypothetical protein
MIEELIAQETDPVILDLEKVTPDEFHWTTSPQRYHSKRPDTRTVHALKPNCGRRKEYRKPQILVRSVVTPTNRKTAFGKFSGSLWQLTLAHLWQLVGQCRGMEMSWASG